MHTSMHMLLKNLFCRTSPNPMGWQWVETPSFLGETCYICTISHYKKHFFPFCADNQASITAEIMNY